MIRIVFATMIAILAGFSYSAAADKPAPLQLSTRSRQAADGSSKYVVAEKTVEWQPERTALVVIDMWDDHWCKGAAARVVELAGPMNAVIAEARERGIFVVHCPSTCVDFYADTPQRQRAIDAPFAKTPVPLAEKERWGTAWCWPDAAREGDLPIDDSDMGCDCAEKCTISAPWKRQIPTIDIAEQDAITDNGQELYNLLAEREIDNVLVMGVHLNMCVLGRPFAIRQLTYLGKNVLLVRDMTDTMYNSQMRPQVDHFTGTDLVVEHVEKHWCPSILSTDLIGGEPFRFQEDRRENPLGNQP
ncbi:MAG: cysteine hydrolase family protein [Pirellulales bacterium]